MPGKNIYLTFDDGPSVPHTEEVLVILSDLQATASFFVCGMNVERNPDILKQIQVAGHAIGNHSYSHRMRNMFMPQLYAEFMKTERIIEEALGIKPSLVRAPWGTMNASVYEKLVTGGHKVIDWDIAAYDWWQPPAKYIADTIVTHAFDGAIVLLHDGHDVRSVVHRSETVKALSTIIKRLRAEGYDFQAIPQDPTK